MQIKKEMKCSNTKKYSKGRNTKQGQRKHGHLKTLEVE